MDSGAAERKGVARWVYSVLPVSLATGPLSTLIQLHLIAINGPTLGVIYASLAVSAYNGVSIPAAMIWGYTTDRLRSRRVLIAVSYGVTGLMVLALIYGSNTGGTILVYSVISLVSAAAATPLNLLIMETTSKSTWAGAFARLSMMSGIGNVAGLVLSTVWAQALPIELLSLPLGICALASAILAYATIQEPPYVFERETIAGRQPSLFSRLLSLPLMFLAIPRLSDFRRMFRGLKYSLTSYVPLFYISTVLFYLASGIFNTSFVPALSAFLISPGEVFAVILVGMVVQTLTFQYAGRYVEGRSLVSSTLQSLVLRGASYALTGVFALLIGGPMFFFPALVLYALGAGVAYAIYYTSSNTMMFNTVHSRSAGSALGVYSAVVGFATLAGSLGSGFISVLFGFHVTFISAGAVLFAAAVLMTRFPPTNEGSR